MIEEYWVFWKGGIAIAIVAVIVPLLSGKFLGVTRGYASLCGILSRRPYFHRGEHGGKFGVRTLFSLGIVIGGFLAALSSGGWHPSWYFGYFDKLFGTGLTIKFVILMFGGVLWGYGSRWAHGCTSGNSISGMAKGSMASLVATLCFMIAGIIVTYTINFMLGGI